MTNMVCFFQHWTTYSLQIFFLLLHLSKAPSVWTNAPSFSLPLPVWLSPAPFQKTDLYPHFPLICVKSCRRIPGSWEETGINQACCMTSHVLLSSLLISVNRLPWLKPSVFHVRNCYLLPILMSKVYFFCASMATSCHIGLVPQTISAAHFLPPKSACPGHEAVCHLHSNWQVTPLLQLIQALNYSHLKAAYATEPVIPFSCLHQMIYWRDWEQ